MIFKNRLVAVASALVLAGSVHAGRGQICPDINDIKAEGMTMSELISANLYFSYNISNYHTDSTWGFVIAPVEAESGDEATDIANEILSSMAGSGIPQQDGRDTYCVYETGDQNIAAIAINAEMVTPNKLRHYIQKAR